MTHGLKLHPEPFQAAMDGLKPWEFRKDDRGFEVGHDVELREFHPLYGYTGRAIEGSITYIIREGYGIPEGYCIFTYQDY
jgi:hypothetical protein